MTIYPVYVRRGQSARDDVNDVIHTQLLYIIDRSVIILIIIIIIIVIIIIIIIVIIRNNNSQKSLEFLLPLEDLGVCFMLPFCRTSIHPKASKERWPVLS